MVRYDKIVTRMCFTGVTLLYVSGAAACLALLREIVAEDGSMAAVYLGVAVALFGVAEKARRAALRTMRRLPR